MKMDARILGAIIVIIIVLLIIGTFRNNTPKCMKSGCNNDRAPKSSYCYVHKPYTGGTPWTGTTNKHSSSVGINKPSKTAGRNSSMEKYDEGYNAVYEDYDWDWDKYQSDDDYRDGVDDALEDYGEYGKDW